MYTVLRIGAGGALPLFEAHLRRLGEAARAPLQTFARGAVPGVYRVWWTAAGLETEARGPSRLVEGLPARLAVSPFAGQRGRFAKPPSPSPYDAVRTAGVATLLTSADGLELYESCVAALVAWDGRELVLAPTEAPGVASVAEAVVAGALPHRRAPLRADADWPLLLVNAVVGTCAVSVSGRGPFPSRVRAQVDALFNPPPAGAPPGA